MERTSEADDGSRSMQFAGDVGDAAATRRWTRESLQGVSDDELEDVLLIVTELVSNAADHGASPHALRLRHLTEPSRLRVEVDDASTDLPVLGVSRLSGNRGRGMVIVDRLAKNWGVVLTSQGKTVWAEITCDQPICLASDA